jgi:hypothetical protein
MVPEDRISVFFFVMAILLAAGNLLFIATNLLAARRRGGGRLYGDALLSPVCWVLGSLAAWRGVAQLARCGWMTPTAGQRYRPSLPPVHRG